MCPSTPPKGAKRLDNPNTFKTSMANAPCANCPMCCLSFLCPPCVNCHMRLKAIGSMDLRAAARGKGGRARGGAGGAPRRGAPGTRLHVRRAAS